MSRELIGYGHEHNVYQSKKEGYVLKLPTFMTQYIMWGFNFDPKVIEDDYKFHEEMLQGTGVRMPKWRIFTNVSPFITKKPQAFWKFLNRKTYVVAQQKINEDHSVKNISQHLENQGLNYLARRSRSNPSNFMSEKGTVYYLDPTHTFTWRGILVRSGLISREKLFK